MKDLDSKKFGGLSIEEIKELIEHSNEAEISMDDMLCDDGAAPNIMEDLIKEIEELHAEINLPSYERKLPND